MEQKRTGLSYVFTLAKEERGKLSLGMLLAVFSSALSFVPYLVVYQILLLIIKQEVTLPAMLGWAGIGIAASKKRPVRLKTPGLFFTPIFVLCAPRRKLPEAQVAAE